MEPILKFLQISDVHLDSDFSSGLNMPPDKVEIRKKEHKGIITKVCQIVKEEEVDIVLIPGDLLDYESSTIDTTNFLIDNFARISPVPVVITPGNHDFYSPSSMYNSDFWTRKKQKDWSDNVIIFRSYNFEAMNIPQCPEVCITGISHSTDRVISERLLKGNVPKKSDKINLLVFHGSLDGYCPPEKKVTFPFSREELLNLDFDYAAIGHYHSYSEIKDSRENIKGAYAGCPLGRNLKECGEKYVIVGKVYEDKNIETEKRKIDDRTIYEIPIDCTGGGHNDEVIN